MITIIGSGKVGACTALFIALKKLDDQIMLIDVVKELAQGESLDLNHMLSAQGIDVEIKSSSNYEDIKNSNIIIIVAGSGRKPGMTRLDLLNTNTKIIKEIVENVRRYSSESILIPVTNPLDPITYVVYKVSGFEKKRVFGMGNMLDLSRFKQLIHTATRCSNSSIDALVIGEHGENMLPLTRFSTIGGIPLESILSQEKLDSIIKDTRQSAARVIELKGATIYAPADAICTIVESIIRNKKQIIPVSTYIDGEYGYSGISVGIPAIIGKNGIEKIIELDLNRNEKYFFKKSVENIKNAISTIKI